MSEANLQGVQDTLFIPLMSRKYVSDVFPEFFHDEKALEIAKKMPQNAIIEKSSEYEMIASASRSIMMDNMVRTFIRKYKYANIVCIGCGLETTVYRLREYRKRCHFYGIDFPDVIEKRKAALGVFQNETLIAGDVNTLRLSQYMDCSLPTFFVVSGVFQYFQKETVVQLIQKLQREFKSAQMIFDTVSQAGLKFVNHYVKKTGNTDAMMYFAINDGKVFAREAGVKLISQQSLYDKVPRDFKKKLKLYTRVSIFVNDAFNMGRIFHLGL